MRNTVKAKIETIRMMDAGETFSILVNFPGFKGPAGDPVAMTFNTTLQEYQDWEAPDGVDKTPEAYVEHSFARPAHDKLTAIHAAIGSLEGQEFDW